ncbi:MAG: phosphatidylserine/phosphatidylglycerophosphate/cardiolipin synthase family protein [Candidatus Taylorbacteria bacterium]|nr:phosphatidylserine/phosphatidylglycerophosphate/cardiolipin synthase family protein [Candidatus Taylorbacteria bacterium]
MDHRIFTTSEKAWEGMIAAIERATASAYLQMYIVGGDEKGREFLESLSRAAKRGVRVVVILDVVGSFNPLDGAIGALREAGAEVLFCSFFFQRMHRKVLVIDEKEAFVGGVNVGKRYARWRDLQVRVTGHVVEAIIRSFSRAYRDCGGKGEILQKNTKAGPLRRAQLWFVDHGLGKRRHEFRNYYSQRIDKAQSSIVLVTPYLFPPRWLLARIHQAILRGVRVDIIMPEATDHAFVNGVNRSFASSFVHMGASCYFLRGMNHAKAMLVDDREGMIGSQNLDMFSFNMNMEAGVFFHESAMVGELRTIVEKWKREARPYDPKNEGFFFKWYDFPTAFLLRLLGFLPLE